MANNGLDLVCCWCVFLCLRSFMQLAAAAAAATASLLFLDIVHSAGSCHSVLLGVVGDRSCRVPHVPRRL